MPKSNLNEAGLRHIRNARSNIIHTKRALRSTVITARRLRKEKPIKKTPKLTMC